MAPRIYLMRGLCGCLLGVVVVLISSCQSTPRVKVNKANYLTLPGQVDAYGITIARHPSIVAAITAGKVQHIKVRAGDVVAEGQVLAELVSSELETRRLSLLSRLSDVRTLENAAYEHLDAVQGMVFQGTAPEARLRLAQFKARRARERREQLETAIQKLEKRISEGVLYASESALVTDCFVREGAHVIPHEPLLGLAMGGRFSAKVYLDNPPEVGSLAEVQLASASLLGTVGEVASSSWALETVRIDWSETPLLAVGWPVKVKISLAPQRVLAIPESALHDGGVYVLKGKRAVWTSVETGVSHSGWIEIRSGINPGADIITWSSAALSDGRAVSISY